MKYSWVVAIFFSLMLQSVSLAAFSQGAALLVEEESKGSCVHGYVDVSLKNDYITPRGLLVTKTGLTTQILAGLSLDVYKDPDPASVVNNISLYGFVWNDLWSDQHNYNVGCWNELDWAVGTNFTLLKNWTLGVQFLEFLSPPGNFTPEKNIESLLAYDDSHWKLPVAFKPYAKWFWTVAGDSTVTVGKHGQTFDIELGLVPTMDFSKTNYPFVLTLPTWVTVGPASFWNGGKEGLKNKNSNWGVFSTGLQLQVPIIHIPARLGSWYVSAGLQYYHLINDSLLKAQTVVGTASTLSRAHRNIYVVYGGIGFRF